MRAEHYIILAAGTVLWCLPFPLARRKQKGLPTLDRRARWGVALEGIAYTALWQAPFWRRSLASWQTALSILLFAIACAFSWTAAFTLGRHLRVDAALAGNHALVRSGPYGIVRHPIYTSMLALLAGSGILLAPWYLLAPAIAIFLAGTAIRIRTEDALLESRFGDEFRAYRRTVPRFIPFVI